MQPVARLLRIPGPPAQRQSATTGPLTTTLETALPGAGAVSAINVAKKKHMMSQCLITKALQAAELGSHLRQAAPIAVCHFGCA